MNDEVMDIRASEISGLRRSLGEMKKQLADIDAAARDNDAILAALHKLALLLISGKKKWRADAEKMLARALPKVSRCRIITLADMTAAQLRQVAKLPAGGAAFLVDDAFAAGGLPSVYSLPLKKGAAVCGLLLLYSRGKNAFPSGTANDFALRLGQLLSAAMAK